MLFLVWYMPQIHHQFVSESFVGGGKEEDKTIAKVWHRVVALIDHLEHRCVYN